MGSTKELNLCKASAGSGKTFTLAVEYIKHLVMNPFSYRNILAVTFTNKATAEMKERILSQLYGIGHGDEGSKDYVQKIKDSDKIQGWYAAYTSKQQKLGLSVESLDTLIRRNCDMALSLMIHDYHRFRIETIDSFFQSVIRELAHDLDLTANLNVELDNKTALHEGVLKVIDSITMDAETKKHVLRYVSEKMDDSRNWHIDSDLEAFGNNIFNEHYMEYRDKLHECLSQKDFLKNYKADIDRHLEYCLEKLISQASKMDNTISSGGFTIEDFKQKTNSVYAYIHKIANIDIKHPNLPKINSYVKKALESADDWSKNVDVVSFVVTNDLMSELQTLTDLHTPAEKILNTVSSIGKHLNNLALINSIDAKVNEVTGERNDFLLANTNHFLHSMIEGSDVPFIYERTGSHFDHIMIDEFQDTSMLQWENFKPLLKNSLDAGKDCLLVGDVKQSIYRWRGGEWSILNELEDDRLLGSHVKADPLKDNYRSKENVIEFNNHFFEKASNELSDDFSLNHEGNFDSIVTAYSDCKQNIPLPDKQAGGYVRVELMGLNEFASSKDNSSTDEDRLDDNGSVTDSIEMKASDQWHCERLATNIKLLLSKGVRQSDICILVRTKKYIPLICDYFEQNVKDENGNPIHIVSDEAYMLKRSEAVMMLITALKALNKPDDRRSLSQLAYRYQSFKTSVNDKLIALDHLLLLQADEIKKYLPSEFSDGVSLSFIPLYELCERLYSILEISKIEGQDSFLYFFFDKLSEYLGKNPSDLDSFLRYWDQTMSVMTMSAGSSSGIQVMTIHKSKGLEFHTVIIPFCNWKIHDTNHNKKNIIWCEPKDPPFDALPACPVNMEKSSEKSIFREDYNEELKKEVVDNLNLVYVAFTRASSNLIIQSSPDDSYLLAFHKTPKAKKGETIKTIYDLIVKSMYDQMVKHPSEELRGDYYEISDTKPMSSNAKGKKSTTNVLLAQPDIISIPFQSYSSVGEFRQSNESRRFVSGSDDEDNEKYQSEGLIFHEIISNIRTLDDVDRAITRLDHGGCFANSKHREDVRELVNKAISDPKCANWFAPHWNVVNEQSILFKDKDGKLTSRRPDRVIYDNNETIVIDYKTGVRDENHKKQVERYKRLLKEMGYKNVKGYLWYIREGKAVLV